MGQQGQSKGPKSTQTLQSLRVQARALWVFAMCQTQKG